MAFTMEISASAPSSWPSFATPFSPSNYRKFRRFCLIKSPAVRPVRCAAPSKEKSEGARQRQERQFFEKYGIDPSQWTSTTPKGYKGSKESNKKERNTQSASDTKEVVRTTHRILKVIRGKARGRKLLSPTSMDVRPMMELVRCASFDMIQVSCGCPTSLLPGRWLDLYSGTGSVGIEAISRGCSEAHFVEMDPWVVEKVLRPNLKHTGFEEQAAIHMVQVETFLGQFEKANCKLGPFDYISVTPPYEAVNYTVLMDHLSKSPLVGKDSFILVEYPKGIVMHGNCGSLVKIADRRYGRTNLAVYGPEWSRRKRQTQTAFQ